MKIELHNRDTLHVHVTGGMGTYSFDVDTVEVEKTPVPDHISADHIEGLCNILDFCLMRFWLIGEADARYAAYEQSIKYARQRAKDLREGKI